MEDTDSDQHGDTEDTEVIQGLVLRDLRVSVLITLRVLHPLRDLTSG
jgi:hypothetical protein